ncbi:MAG: methionyl-tRNA formyltransferase [Candidatus Gygaella obscura]|nr:methionyl-tRNA formyltransferase [Candidatus Gygaella obscura]
MKIIFFGSSGFSLESLRLLNNSGHKIILVVSQPSRKMGRHLHLTSTPVEKLAKQLSLEAFSTEDINSKDSLKILKEKKADLFVVVSYGQIFKGDFLKIPKTMCINLHASLLPKYRGASPINWSIINGDTHTGVTIFKVEQKMDSGGIILQDKITIDDMDTAVSLTDKLSVLGAKVLIDSVDKIVANDFKLISQDESKATYTSKLTKELGLIDWNKDAASILNQIRGCFGWPGSFTYYRGRLMKIFTVSVENVNLTEPGKVIRISGSGILVQCAKDSLSIKELQLESGKRMDSATFLAGHKITSGEKLGKI